MGQKRILIVEDSKDLRLILRHQLQSISRLDILEAAHGQDALEVVARETLDLIVMNLGLPVLDGWEVTRRIRTLPSPVRDVPIMALTAYAMPGDEQKALAAGCDDYLAKPVVDFTVLRNKVEQLLAHGRARQP
jgi:two-component system cell cycle response regulator DivK